MLGYGRVGRVDGHFFVSKSLLVVLHLRVYGMSLLTIEFLHWDRRMSVLECDVLGGVCLWLASASLVWSWWVSREVWGVT